MGLTIGVGLYTGQRPGRSYRDVLVLARAAEEAGFDAFWVSEHHGLDDRYLPDPLSALAAAAAVTGRILLGTGVLLAPLRHPVALAEQAAVVDELSEGRLILGLGLGYLASEYALFGVDRRQRAALLEQAVAVVRERSPRLPIWLGGYADDALRRARRMADGHLVGRGDLALVQRAVTVLGPPDDDFTVAVNLVTAPDGAARAGVERQQRAYEELQRADNPYAGAVDPAQVHLGGDGTAWSPPRCATGPRWDPGRACTSCCARCSPRPTCTGRSRGWARWAATSCPPFARPGESSTVTSRSGGGDGWRTPSRSTRTPASARGSVWPGGPTPLRSTSTSWPRYGPAPRS